ncbi:hypothetical protein KY309_01745 [Candidatus Woesearchaeota archaeon]|nr:hypothetical protein [Candidatus Woesearchaeota archaeon]MBW3016312.1 hypothetical protein [Candidatus Woesearchaeota archaeon]
MKTIKDGYEEALQEITKHKEIIVLGTRTNKFAKEHPNKFVKISSEQNIMGIATGMAMEGKIPFANTCPTAGKNWDQTKAICQENTNIKIADENNDIAILRTQPNIIIISPADYYEAKKATIAAATIKAPVYIKLATEKEHATNKKTPFTLGRVEIMRAGKDCTIIATGTAVQEAIKAAEKLSKQEIECTVLNCHTIQPIDKHAILSSARLTGCIVTAEEHTTGGLGSATAEILSQNLSVPLKISHKETSSIIKAVKETILRKIENICTEIPEEHGKMMFKEISPELHFRLHGGGIIKSIPGLQKALLNMSEETFIHHCNTHRNDFSKWIKEVFNETTLSNKIEKTHTKMGMILAIQKWIR